METPPPLSPAFAPAPERRDPTWWRLGNMPFVVLVLAAVGFDLAWPDDWDCGIGTGVGCALWLLAMLLLRRDFSRGEQWFFAAFALISLLALGVSGNHVNWVLAFFLPLFYLLIPVRREAETAAEGPFRTWWGYWLARRKTAEKGCSTWLRQILPTLITVFVGVVLFIVFLIIFAIGNPLVHLIWKTLMEWWNALVQWLELDWDFLVHALMWFLGFLLFGFFTFERPAEFKPLPPVPAEAQKAGRSLLPHLPLASLIGINLAFLIATSTDIAYLWFGRVPEGISQTYYLHEGAVSITWAAVLASAILVFLFRRKGSARQGRCTRGAGYLLAFQTFLLALSVYVRLYHQFADYGFTPHRIQAAEALLLGLDGLVILVCYMTCSGSFWKYARLCLGSMLLLLIAFGIYPPAEMAGSLNLRYAPTHPQWSFGVGDFRPGRFAVGDNLAFSLYVQQSLAEPNENFDARLRYAAARVEERATREGWCHWNLSLRRDIPAAEIILNRPIRPQGTAGE